MPIYEMECPVCKKLVETYSSKRPQCCKGSMRIVGFDKQFNSKTVRDLIKRVAELEYRTNVLEAAMEQDEDSEVEIYTNH